jgi:hypothetical protein
VAAQCFAMKTEEMVISVAGLSLEYAANTDEHAVDLDTALKSLYEVRHPLGLKNLEVERAEVMGFDSE